MKIKIEQEPSTWHNLSIRDRAKYIHNSVKNHFANGGSMTDISIDDIKQQFDKGKYSAENLVDAIYTMPNIVEELPEKEPIEHYLNTIPEEEAIKLGYFEDERGHRDDRVKLESHPTHPSRGNFNDLFIYNLTDKGIQDPNYSIFGIVDGGQDPQATLIYDNGIVLPEITVSPQGNYFHNTYDDIKIYNNGGILLHQFNTGGNTLTNEAQPKNDWRKDSSNKQAYIKDLDEWITKNPTFKGSNGTIYNTADFRDMFIQLVGHESSYNPNASSGSYTGYYQIHKNENPNLNQHTRAFKHIDRLFQDNITDYDLKRAKELGINQAALLMKYWNQGNHVNNYLHNSIDHEDGVGTKISLYGNDMDADFDMTNYVSKAITDNYAFVPKGGNLWNIAKLARNKNITNYADQKNLITAYNQERNTSFDSKKLQVGDTIWLIPTNISEKPTQKIKTQETSQIDSKVNYDNPQGLPWYNVLLDNIKRTFGWEPPEGRYDFAKGGYLNNRYRRY